MIFTQGKDQPQRGCVHRWSAHSGGQRTQSRWDWAWGGDVIGRYPGLFQPWAQIRKTVGLERAGSGIQGFMQHRGQQAAAFGLGSVELLFHLVTQGHQFLHLRHDAPLFGEGWEREN